MVQCAVPRECSASVKKRRSFAYSLRKASGSGRMNGTASTIAAARHDQHSPAGLHKGAKGGLDSREPRLDVGVPALREFAPTLLINRLHPQSGACVEDQNIGSLLDDQPVH